MTTKEVFVAGRVTDSSNPRKLGWRLLGIFTTEELAVVACKTKRDFVRCFDADVLLEDQGNSLVKIWFPLKKGKKS